MYETGQGVQQDFEKAVKYYQQAADQGQAASQFNLGTMYIKGQGVKQDFEKAEYYALFERRLWASDVDSRLH